MFFRVFFVGGFGYTIKGQKLGKMGVCVFNGKVHFGFAFIIWLLVSFAPEHPVPIEPFSFLIGSVFPDADIKYSRIGKILPLWLFFKHRGFTHTLWGMIVFGGIVFMFFDVRIMCSFLLGYWLHLFMDSSTPMGVKWLGKRKKHLRFK